MVGAKLYPLERTEASRKCSKKQCQVCENTQNSDTFGSSVASDAFKINHQMTNDICPIYLLTSKTCSKQYTVETDQFRS